MLQISLNDVKQQVPELTRHLATLAEIREQKTRQLAPFGRLNQGHVRVSGLSLLRMSTTTDRASAW